MTNTLARYRTSILCLILFFSTAVHGDTSSIRQFLTTTVSQHHDILALSHQLDATTHTYSQLKQWDNPEVSLEAGTQDTDGTQGTALDIALNQRVPNAKQQRAIRHEIDLQRQQATLELEIAQSQLWYSLLIKLYELKSLSLKIEDQRQRLADFDWVSDYLSGRPFLSPLLKSQKTLLELHVSEQRLTLARLQRDYRRLKADIATFSHKPTPKLGPIPIIQKLPNKDWLMDVALPTQRIHTQSLQLSAEQKRLTASQKPSLTYLVLFNQQNSGQQQQTITAGVSLPLWVRQTQRHLLNANSSEQRALSESEQHTSVILKQQIDHASLQFDYANHVLTAYNSQRLSETVTQFNDALKAFQNEQVDAMTLIALYDQLMIIKTMRHDAVLSKLDAWATLMTMTPSRTLPGDHHD